MLPRSATPQTTGLHTHTTHIHPHTHHTHTYSIHTLVHIIDTFTAAVLHLPSTPLPHLAAHSAVTSTNTTTPLLSLSVSCIDRPLLALPSTLAPAPSRLREVVAPPLVANSLSHHRLLAGTVLSTRVSPSTVSLPISIYVDISKKKNHHDY